MNSSKEILSGSFFCFEGIDGAGKSTLITLVAELLNQKNTHTVLTREPGGTALGTKIRDILQHSKNTPISPYAELLLFFADRVQHLNEIVLPAMQNGSIVLSDRFYYSTIAYQCFGRGLSRNSVNSLIDITLESFKPNGVVLVDIPVETGLERASGRSSPDRFEMENVSFHKRIREGFLELSREDPDRFLVLDGTLEPVILADKVLRFINEKTLPGEE
jgi:dTMP kinase